MSDVSIQTYDLVVIGGGLAGLRVALEASKDGHSVAVLSKVNPLRSHSVAAQGGINAALGNAPDGRDDTWERHAFDTVKGSDYLADQDAVDVLCREAPAAVYELEHMGCVFSRFEDGRIAQRPFGGAGFPRTCYAADRTGHNLLHTLYEQVIDRGIAIYEEYFVTSLVTSGNACVGCIAMNMADGTFHGFSAKVTLLATGGYGRLFARSTNAMINTGDGAALAIRARAPLKDMEFVQFHPTTLIGTNILITEGARGEGGYLFNNKQERFMERYAKKAMELAPRDIVARAIQKEIDEGRGFEDEYVHLDLTHLGADRINERLPGIRQITIDFAGIDPVESPIPIQPGQHYSMGGISCDPDGKTPLQGLYAVGEAACISVHGANRLGGNSLLETLVFGKVVGGAISRDLPSYQDPDPASVEDELVNEKERIDALLSREDGERASDIRNEMKKVMFDHFGVFRERGKMEEGLAKVKALKLRLPNVVVGNTGNEFNQSLTNVLELEFLLDIALTVAIGALAREESRGSHSRLDFESRDDERFLKHSMTSLKDSQIFLEYSDVTLGKFEVKERTY